MRLTAQKNTIILMLCALLVLFISAMPPLYSETTKQAGSISQTETAIFAGGCFWCVESDFDKVPGVIETISGYIGGHTKDPTYQTVTTDKTGHYEAVKINYDPNRVSYKQLLDVFWHSVDPTDDGGQFCDRGASYKTAIFTSNEQQATDAKQSKEWQNTKGKLKGRIVTPILKASQFYKAEEYHQDYYKKNPMRYNYYRFGCARDRILKKLWGDDALKGIKELSSSKK